MKKMTLFLVLCFSIGIIFAQENLKSQSKYSGDIQSTMPVKVWGEVVNPGIYNVPLDYDMLGILSIAGGPIKTAKLTNVKVIRGRRLDQDDPIVVYVDLDKYIETGDESLIPEIRENDTIMVPPKFGKNFMTNFAAILAIAQSITIMAYYIDRVSEAP